MPQVGDVTLRTIVVDGRLIFEAVAYDLHRESISKPGTPAVGFHEFTEFSYGWVPYTDELDCLFAGFYRLSDR